LWRDLSTPPDARYEFLRRLREAEYINNFHWMAEPDWSETTIDIGDWEVLQGCQKGVAENGWTVMSREWCHLFRTGEEDHTGLALVGAGEIDTLRERISSGVYQMHFGFRYEPNERNKREQKRKEKEQPKPEPAPQKGSRRSLIDLSGTSGRTFPCQVYELSESFEVLNNPVVCAISRLQRDHYHWIIYVGETTDWKTVLAAHPGAKDINQHNPTHCLVHEADSDEVSRRAVVKDIVEKYRPPVIPPLASPAQRPATAATIPGPGTSPSPPKQLQCPRCYGSGSATCSACNGSGGRDESRTDYDWEGNPICNSEWISCGYCNGGMSTCSRCRGNGYAYS
jgi:hypothetical protein